MKSAILICLFMFVAFTGYCQQETVIKGTGPTGTPVEYHLLKSTITTKGEYKYAVVKKVFVNDNEFIVLNLKVDCKAKTYIILETEMEGATLITTYDGMNPVTAGSPMEKVVNTICTE